MFIWCDPFWHLQAEIKCDKVWIYYFLKWSRQSKLRWLVEHNIHRETKPPQRFCGQKIFRQSDSSCVARWLWHAKILALSSTVHATRHQVCWKASTRISEASVRDVLNDKILDTKMCMWTSFMQRKALACPYPCCWPNINKQIFTNFAFKLTLSGSNQRIFSHLAPIPSSSVTKP